MELIVNNYIIEEPIENIIYTLKQESTWDVFKDIQRKENYLRVTCPWHKDGIESHPSCSIYTDYHSENILPGTVHCFTCGKKATIFELISYVLDITEEEAKNWLINRYGILFEDRTLDFISSSLIPKQTETVPTYLDETILDKFKYYHPYLQKRKIPFEIAKKFSVGWNEMKNTITFPVWDENNNLVMITERSIDTKRFYIQAGVEKPVYLLNFAKQENVNYLFICESQINALTCWGYGFPAVALIGTGTPKQYESLKNSGIKKFILCFDGDEAGRRGAQRFIKNMPISYGIIDIQMPSGKDVNDLSQEDFIRLLNFNGLRSLDQNRVNNEC